MAVPALDVRVSASVKAPLPAARLARLAAAVLRAEGVRRATVSLTLVGRRRMRSLNRDHLGRDRETDVIAFALSTAIGNRQSGIAGDIYVCVPVAVAQARWFATTPNDELRRLVVHGLLHVLGHDHPRGAGRTASPMWRRQERYLARFGGLAR